MLEGQKAFLIGAAHATIAPESGSQTVFHGSPSAWHGPATTGSGGVTDILLVEDNDGHAELIVASLQAAGVNNSIHRVYDGEEALEFVHRAGAYADRAGGNPLLIILDLSLPRLDGYEVLQRLKTDPPYQDIPIVILTTSVDVEDHKRCDALRCYGYYSKWNVFLDFPAFVQKLSKLVRITIRTGV